MKEHDELITKTIRAEITPEEDDLLAAFRELGEKKGSAAQDVVLRLIQTMAEENNGDK